MFADLSTRKQNNLHILVNKKVEAVKVEIANTRLQSVLDGEETVQHDVFHAILQQNIHGAGLLYQDFTVVSFTLNCPNYLMGVMDAFLVFFSTFMT